MSTTPAKITLQSSDGETFEIDEAVAVQIEAIKLLIDDECFDNLIPLPNVTGAILAKVVQYCTKHVEFDIDTQSAKESLSNWDADFMKVDQNTLFDLMLAANYLNIENLLDLTCKTVANMMKGRTIDQIRKTFNIKNDLSPEEEEEIHRENHWAFE